MFPFRGRIGQRIREPALWDLWAAQLLVKLIRELSPATNPLD